MDELSEKLAGLLNDPDTMERVRQMAENLLGENNTQANTEQVSDFSPLNMGDELATVMSIIGKLKNSDDDSRTKLLIALKPHLSEPKREKVDTAIKILKLLELLPLIKETGILGIT